MVGWKISILLAKIHTMIFLVENIQCRSFQSCRAPNIDNRNSIHQGKHLAANISWNRAGKSKTMFMFFWD
jgi:hypothetical protein